jgi:branched-chain amino acid transport system permease protein
VFGPDFDPTQYRMLVFGFAMVAIMVWRPRGLISARAPSLFLRERQAIAAGATRKGRSLAGENP